MEERTTGSMPAERPSPGRAGLGPLFQPGVPAPADARPIDDPRALTILTTEHWSLLSARSLVYNEAFARAGMFLTFLSATLVVLGLISAATGFTREFLFIAAVVLSVDLFVGLATLGRVTSATTDDLRFLAGMNRIRHAYHEMVPGLERYFMSGWYDDMRGIFAVYATTHDPTSRPGVLHGFTTTPGMLGLICASLAGSLAGVVAVLITDVALFAGLVAVAVFAALVATFVVRMTRIIGRFAATLQSVFPTPRSE